MIVKKGKVYVEGETKMENNNTQNNIDTVEDMKMNKNYIKAIIMEKHKGDYLKTISDFCYRRHISLREDEFKLVNDLFETIKSTDVCKTALNNSLLSIESGVYENDKYYLLDLRAFQEMKDEMIDAFMVIYNKEDFSFYTGEVDDVWEFTDWTELE